MYQRIQAMHLNDFASMMLLCSLSCMNQGYDVVRELNTLHIFIFVFSF
jgi:hypothetical protein